MTAVTTDTEILDGLDFDEVVPCEWPEHGKPAKYLAIAPCGCRGLLCDTCRTNHESWDTKEGLDSLVRCERCFTSFRRDKIRVVPLP